MPEPAKVCGGSIKYMHPAPQRNKFINIPYSNIFYTLLNVPITVNVYCTISNVLFETTNKEKLEVKDVMFNIIYVPFRAQVKG